MKKNIFLFSAVLTLVTFIYSCGRKTPPTFEEFVKEQTSDTTFLNQFNSYNNGSDKSFTFSEIDMASSETPPKYPFKEFFTQLPDNELSKKYVAELSKFLDYKIKLQSYQAKYKSFLIDNNFLAEPNSDYIAKKIYEWNGDIFWSPASMTNDIINSFGDEVRSVFGNIPNFDVSRLGKFTNQDGSTVETVNLGLQVDGNWVVLKPNPSKPGSPLEFEHRDVNGNFIKWTTNVEKCDKPSLAGGVTPCGTSSRLSVIKKGSIEWIALARKTKREEILTPENYWLESNHTYELLGYIGFNKASGEVAFFDGSYDGQTFTYDKPVIAPGGNGYNDNVGRNIAKSMYDPLHRIDCAGCHDNKEPRIVTPYIKQARVGFSDEPRSIKFGVGEILTDDPGKAAWPYRVIGSNFNLVNTSTIQDGRTIKDPNRNCTSCHSLTNFDYKFAMDAVAKFNGLDNYRTDWAKRTGLGKIHPWMVPEEGNVLEGNPREITQAEWEALEKYLADPSLDPNSKKTYTKAPAPESIADSNTRIGDPSMATNFTCSIKTNRNGDNSTFPNEMLLSWNYLNNFGGVDNRDDVRFDIAITETEIQSSQLSENDYPKFDFITSSQLQQISGEVYKLDSIIVVKNASYEKHIKFTDAVSSTTPRNYSLNIPVKANKRYLITIVAKRFTFDNDKTKYSKELHHLTIDSKVAI